MITKVDKIEELIKLNNEELEKVKAGKEYFELNPNVRGNILRILADTKHLKSNLATEWKLIHKSHLKSEFGENYSDEKDGCDYCQLVNEQYGDPLWPNYRDLNRLCKGDM